MPTARELLDQADALMRRNRAHSAPPAATDTAVPDFPVLTEAIDAEVAGEPTEPTLPETQPNAPSPNVPSPVLVLDDVPVLTDIVEEIEAPTIAEEFEYEGEPSRWLDADRGDTTITGPMPDSVMVVASEGGRASETAALGTRGRSRSDAAANEAQPIEHPIEAQPIEEQAIDEQPIDAQPIDEQPIDEQPIDVQPIDEQPIDEQAIDEQAIDEQPIDEQPIDEQPIDAQPIDAQPIDAQPIDVQPIDVQPIDEQAIDEQPIDEQPIDEQPIDEQAIDEQPIDAQPIDEQPIDAQPIDAQPIDAQPIDAQPIDAQPIDEQPIDEQPIDEQPIDEQPIDEQPIDVRPAIDPSMEQAIEITAPAEALDDALPIVADAAVETAFEDAAFASVGARVDEPAHAAEAVTATAANDVDELSLDELEAPTAPELDAREPVLEAPEEATTEPPSATAVLASARAEGVDHELRNGAAARLADDQRWDALAEDIRMQVLQRIDIFTDTGLRAQLTARLQPIVDRASADLVATINQHVGQLIRSYVAEAIEREIEKWRQDSR